jgi:formyltetrahydrofolate-dependent phosphoribosylglycinamide formyltransferase
MFRLAVFVSGRGSNLKAILDAISIKYLNVEISAVFADKQECGAIDLAKSQNIPVYFVSKIPKDNFILLEQASDVLINLKIDLIVLAGFLKKIPDNLVDHFSNKIINIHPALLPSFGGEGMYGMNVHRSVFNASCKVSGATVHFVDKVYDNGKIIAQSCVDINDVQSPEEIAARVLEIEHKLLPYVIKNFSENKITIADNRVFILN